MKWNCTSAHRTGRRVVPLLVVAALLALAPAATASTHVLRPTTTAASGGWTVTPTGSDIAAALADNVTQPATPDTGSGFITSPGANSWTSVAVAAPALAGGENITGTTAWAYLSTGTTRSATVVLASGSTVLGWASVPSGHSPQWYAVTTSTPPTPAQANSLYLAITPAGKSTAVNVYAGYVDLETDAPVDQAGGSSPAATGPSGTTGTGTEGTSANGGGGRPSALPLAATVAPLTALTAKPSGVVSVPVSCPAIQLPGCTGTVAIQLLASPAPKLGNRASAARRRKIAVRATRAFKVAAGAKAMVPVVLDRRTVRALRHKGRIRARVTVTTDVGDGKQAVTVRDVTVRERRTVRRAPRQARRGGVGH